LNRRKRQIQRRLDKFNCEGCERPMFTASNIHYEISDRNRGIAHGGIGALHSLANRFGLADAIDRRLVLFKIHLPYHESDHVLNIAYNAFCGGTCLEDIELRRNDEVFLDALGARRIPDPTTAGDFCRRFRDAADIRCLQNAFHDVRKKVWALQPDAFFHQAILDMDGTLVGTTGSCKQGMDISYKGTWGYHPLVVSLANTSEVLSIVNRSGNRPSHEGAAAEVERCLAVCFEGGFRRVLLRGDTDFSQTQFLDGWNADPRIQFCFGYDNCPNLVKIADELPPAAWQKLERPPRYEVATRPRQRPENVKDRIVKQRAFDTLRLQSEEVAEFSYQPTACHTAYRMVVVRKNITKEKGELRLLDDIRYFFYITNDRACTTSETVFCANDRCNQENLLAQLHGGCRALQAPVDNLESNWAYMVMTGLAWDMKAWWALLLPEGVGRHQECYRADKLWVLRLEFKTFVQAFVQLPCQIARTSRRIIYRLLSWNPYQAIFFRLVAMLRC
jgi:Transposase DDE domain group 1